MGNYNCLNQTKHKLVLSKRFNGHVASSNCMFDFQIGILLAHLKKKKKKLQQFPFQECDLT